MKIRLTFLTLAILSFIFLSGQGCEKQQAACTEDAKICPGGAVVVREPPSCEFQKCPELPADCGVVDVEFRDSCCAEKMKDQPHILCTGNWNYVNGGCRFVCETTPTGIPKECSEKDIVGVYDCKDGIKKAVIGNLGGGFKILNSDRAEESCPVVAPQYITETCKKAAEEGYCADKNLCE